MKAREPAAAAWSSATRSLVGDVSSEPDALARVQVEPRRSTLRRTADDTDPVERIIVANASSS
jgi:ribosome biogenesis GTPase